MKHLPDADKMIEKSEQWTAEWKEIYAELDALRAENEVHRRLAEDRAQEIQRLKNRLLVEEETVGNLVEDNERLRELGRAMAETASELGVENTRLRAALRRITDQGKVCAEFELCTHVACQSSYEAWSVADAALKGETPESANERAIREFGHDKRA